MNTKRIALIAFSAMLISGCWGNRELLQQSGSKPGWVESSRESYVETRDGAKYVYYRALVSRARDLALAKREARFELVKAIANEVSADIIARYRGATSTSSNQIDVPSDVGGMIQDAVNASSNVQLADLRVEEVYWERRLYQTDMGPKEGYEVFVLGSVPEEGLRRLKAMAISGAKKAAQKQQNQNAVQLLNEMDKQLENNQNQ